MQLRHRPPRPPRPPSPPRPHLEPSPEPKAEVVVEVRHSADRIVDAVARVAYMLDDSFRAWCASSPTAMFSHRFHSVCVHATVDGTWHRLSFHVCEAHVRACLPDLHALLEAHGVFRASLPVPSKLLMNSHEAYKDECVRIFRHAFPPSPLDDPDADVLVAYAACVCDTDVTNIVGVMLIVTTWYAMAADAAMRGTTTPPDVPAFLTPPVVT